MKQNGGPFWEVLRLCLSAFDIPRIPVTAKEFKEVRNCGPHAELFFFLPRNMRSKTDPIEPGHVSFESPLFTCPFAQLEVLLPARNDPLSQAAISGFSWPH